VSERCETCGDNATQWDYDQLMYFCDRHVQQADFTVPVEDRKESAIAAEKAVASAKCRWCAGTGLITEDVWHMGHVIHEKGEVCEACSDPWDKLSGCSPDTIAAVMGAPLCCEFCGGDHLARYCGNK
jgi:hypothetical protein